MNKDAIHAVVDHELAVRKGYGIDEARAVLVNKNVTNQELSVIKQMVKSTICNDPDYDRYLSACKDCNDIGFIGYGDYVEGVLYLYLAFRRLYFFLVMQKNKLLKHI